MDKSENSILSEKVYRHVLEMILRKEINCGEKIPEERITQLLGVSRTPIREAMRRLSNDGIVNIFPKRFAEVVAFDEKSIKDLGIVRISLDILAAKLAITYGSNADFMRLNNLADLCSEAAKNGDIYSRIKYDCDFHLALTEISGNPILLKLQKELYLRVHLLQATRFTVIEDSLKGIEGHYLIVEGLLKRNQDEVIMRIQQHLAPFYGVDLSVEYAPNAFINY